MLSAADNELLTRTGRGTPMGAFFRRFWQPAVLSREVAAPDGPPVRVRIMGEDFVAFRGTDGRVGLVDPRCAHRGADLYFGRNEACGLRCAYHGWKYDAAGRCVDLPNAKPGTGL
ncbi:MAG TPA: Rieske 2Fe-2S domain-containing protein, partial [Terriglobales bacterium]|nr:Rieske 2Fe-2S domain-containing protein [Terriglobales bacterium]